MKVLVTGGAGYLGSTLCRKLLEKGHEVRVLDNMTFGNESIMDLKMNTKFEVVEGDVRDMTTVIKCLRDCDAVIHLASIVGDAAGNMDKNTTIAVNYISTRNIAELCKLYGIKQFLYASTCSVYGDSSEAVLVESSTKMKPVSLYGDTKLKSELEIMKTGVKYCILRLGTLFGYSQRMRFDLAINLFIAKAIKDEEITVFGGEQYRPFLHVEDAADGFIKALEGKWYGIFNVAIRNIKIIDVVRELQEKYFKNLKYNVKKYVVDERNYKVSCTKISRKKFKPNKDIDFAVKEIKNAFDAMLIIDYTETKYSNYKHLFENNGLAKKVWCQGPISERA